MVMGSSAGFCRCGTRLARDNSADLCATCKKQARGALAEAPHVPPEFWQGDQLRAALHEWHMGRVIQAYRRHPWHGRVLPQGVVAGWMHMTQTQLSRMETGPPPQDLAKLIQWARALRIPAELLWFMLPETGSAGSGSASEARDESSAADLPMRIGPGCSVLDTVLVRVQIDGQEVAVPLDRRALLRDGLAASLTTALATESLNAIQPFGVGPSRAKQELTAAEVGDLVAQLREQWHLLVKTDNLFGPRYALASVRQQLAVLADVLPTTRDGTRREVVRLAAQYAESASWLHEDAGEFAQAQQLIRQAMEWAQEADDRAMLAWTLFRRSNQAASQGDGAQTISLVRAALRNERALSSPMRAALAQQQAHGFAIDGDEVAAHRWLDHASRWASSDTAGEAREGHGAFCTETYLQLQRAHCWLRLGRPKRALQVYETALPTLPSVYRRDRGVALANFSAACAGANEPERAAAIGRQALAIARSSGSVRTERTVAQVGRRLAEHSDQVPVSALLGELSAGESS